MKKIITLFVIAFMTLTTVTAQDNSSVKAEIQENSNLLKNAMNEGDYETYGSFFTDDAMFKISGHDPLSGREAITAAHKPMTEQGVQLNLNTEEVLDFGDYAYEIGNYELITKDGQKMDHGYYSTLWKKIDGKWKIYRDVISSSVAMK